jgi:hypothetical protein
MNTLSWPDTNKYLFHGFFSKYFREYPIMIVYGRYVSILLRFCTFSRVGVGNYALLKQYVLSNLYIFHSS